jgi:hypothetical protein
VKPSKRKAGANGAKSRLLLEDPRAPRGNHGMRLPVWIALVCAASACGGGSGASADGAASGAGAAGLAGDSVAASAGSAGDTSPGGEADMPSGGATSSAGTNASGAGGANAVGPRLVLGVEPPVDAGTFRLSSSGFIVQQSSCAGSVCVRGFLGTR